MRDMYVSDGARKYRLAKRERATFIEEVEKNGFVYILAEGWEQRLYVPNSPTYILTDIPVTFSLIRVNGKLYAADVHFDKEAVYSDALERLYEAALPGFKRFMKNDLHDNRN